MSGGRGHGAQADGRTLPLMPTLLRGSAHAAIRAYQLTLSGAIGRQCRYLPTCSAYADDAIARHGLWCGGWMGLARLCRCHPWADEGFDPVPEQVPLQGTWFRPWRYGTWRMKPDQERASSSAASP